MFQITPARMTIAGNFNGTRQSRHISHSSTPRPAGAGPAEDDEREVSGPHPAERQPGNVGEKPGVVQLDGRQEREDGADEQPHDRAGKQREHTARGTSGRSRCAGDRDRGRATDPVRDGCQSCSSGLTWLLVGECVGARGRSARRDRRSNQRRAGGPQTGPCAWPTTGRAPSTRQRRPRGRK